MKRVIVIPNGLKDPENKYLDRIQQLLTGIGCQVLVGTSSLTSGAELVIVLGGDGSMLRAARVASPLGVPLLGINLGRIGYMTELETSEIDRVVEAFSDQRRVDTRMMLSVEIYRGGEKYASYNALNEAVVSNGVISRMVEITLSRSGSTVFRYHADGLIIATPTGSTAYSLSAGGPVVDPGLECFCVTPVSAHSLVARPMIFSADSELEIADFGQIRGELYLTVDGRENIKLVSGDRVIIRRSSLVTRFIRLGRHDFYDVLSNKMSEN